MKVAGLLSVLALGASPQVLPEHDHVIVDGTLTNALVSATVDILHTRPQTRVVKVRSSGGDPEAAIKLGDYIEEHQLDIVVQDYCLSSCALFVALAGRSVSLEPGAVLGFHHSQTAFEKQFARLRNNSSLDWERIDRVSRMERDAFERWGRESWWLTEPMMLLDASCIRERSFGGTHSVPRYMSKFTVWMPPRSRMPNATGPWPETIPANALQAFGIDAPVASSKEPYPSDLLPICSD